MKKISRNRMELYKKLGLKTTIVHKSGAMVIFPGKHLVSDNHTFKKQLCF